MRGTQFFLLFTIYIYVSSVDVHITGPIMMLDCRYEGIPVIETDICPPPFEILPATNECLFVGKEVPNWDSARSACIALGADLAIPQDFKVLQKHFSTIPQGARLYYVGGHDRAAPQTKYSWINGEAVTGPWANGAPYFTKEENCLIVGHSDGKLYHAFYGCSSDLGYGYVCQKGFIN